MKYLLLVLLLLSSVQAAPTSRKPVVKDGMVIRTQQQDAELRDWIVGIQTENRLNATRAEAAEQAQKSVLAILVEVNAKADSLQLEINAVQKLADKVPGLEIKLAKSSKLLAWSITTNIILTVACGVLVYLLFKP